MIVQLTRTPSPGELCRPLTDETAGKYFGECAEATCRPMVADLLPGMTESSLGALLFNAFTDARGTWGTLLTNQASERGGVSMRLSAIHGAAMLLDRERFASPALHRAARSRKGFDELGRASVIIDKSVQGMPQLHVVKGLNLAGNDGRRPAMFGRSHGDQVTAPKTWFKDDEIIVVRRFPAYPSESLRARFPETRRGEFTHAFATVQAFRSNPDAERLYRLFPAPFKA